LTAFIVDVIVKLVRANHYNLAEFSAGINALDTNEQYTLTGEVAACAADFCDSITVRDLLYLLAEIKYLVSFKGLKSEPDCSLVHGNISFIPLGDFKTINIASL